MGQETKLLVGVAISRAHRLLNNLVRVCTLLHALVGDTDIIVWTINTSPYTTAIIDIIGKLFHSVSASNVMKM